MADDLAAALAGIRERNEQLRHRYGYVGGLLALADAKDDVPRLLAAVEATLEQADDLTRKSEALDAEAEYVIAEHPEAAAVAVLKRERSIAYDECARWFRAAITAALAAAQAAEAGDG
jgi:hypothetical protein